CEITYINHIEISDSHADLSKIFNGWSTSYALNDLAEIEDIKCAVRHLLKDGEGKFIGRLHINIQPGFRLSDDQPLYLMELTVRGMPFSDELEGILAFMDMGREKIVRAFTAITSSSMHHIWEREV